MAFIMDAWPYLFTEEDLAKCGKILEYLDMTSTTDKVTRRLFRQLRKRKARKPPKNIKYLVSSPPRSPPLEWPIRTEQ